MIDMTLKTPRLLLRPPVPSDGQFMTDGLSDVGVTRWLANVPHPYTREMADDWLARPDNIWPDLAVVTHQGDAVDCVDTKGGSIGYWLARAAWGQGFMTEAARAVRDHFFARSDAGELRSGYFVGNAASEGVLRKLGFSFAGIGTLYNVAQGKDLPHVDMALSRSGWEARA